MPNSHIKFKIFIKIFGFLSFLLFSLLAIKPTFAKEEKKVTAYFFYGNGCPHCAREEHFLNYLQEKYDFLETKKYEIYYSKENTELLQKIATKMQIEGSGVPVFIVGEKAIIGYLNDETTGKEIEKLILSYYETENCPDIVGNIICNSEETKSKIKLPEEIKVSLPFFGQINVGKFSLPALTVILGLADGFNPCAMWTLLFLISLLLSMEDKKRMWILGGAFIITSAFVYFLFMVAWLNILLFLGFISTVRIAIGLIALASGIYNLREYFTNKAGSCKVVNSQKRQKTFENLKKITADKRFLMALTGMILLAFAVNLVEVVCSAGLPAIYTQVLTLAKLPSLQYYLYILGYIFFYMLDDLVVFGIAMTTLQVTGISHKYSRFSHLVGGAIIFILGLLLIFKPEWIMFG